MTDPTCPHCNLELNIDATENYQLYDPDEVHEFECLECEKKYFIKPIIEFTFECSKDKDWF